MSTKTYVTKITKHLETIKIKTNNENINNHMYISLSNLKF